MNTELSLITMYLLRRKELYKDYMADFRTLVKWAQDTKPESPSVPLAEKAPIICGECFSIWKDSIPGGGILISCPACNTRGNMGYEISKLAEILQITEPYCIYLICKATENIYNMTNNVAVIPKLFL